MIYDATILSDVFQDAQKFSASGVSGLMIKERVEVFGTFWKSENLFLMCLDKSSSNQVTGWTDTME